MLMQINLGVENRGVAPNPDCMKNIQKRPFVHNSVCSVCSQFSESVFAILGECVRNFGGVFAVLFEGLLIEIQEEIHYFAVLGGGGVRGNKL